MRIAILFRFCALLYVFALSADSTSAVEYVFPSGASPESMRALLQMDADVGFERDLGIVTKPYHQDIVVRLLEAVRGDDKLLRANALQLLTEVVRQKEVPTTTLIEAILPAIVPLTSPAQDEVAEVDQIATRLARRVAWLTMLATVDGEVRQERLVEALRREDQDSQFYVRYAVMKLASTGDVGEQLLTAESNRPDLPIEIRPELELGVAIAELRRDLEPLSAEQKLLRLQGTLESMLVDHRAILRRADEATRSRLIRQFEWVLEQVQEISQQGSTDILRRMATSIDMDPVIRLRAEYSLVEKGELAYRFILVSPGK